MNRALVFLLRAPTSVAFMAWLIDVGSGSPWAEFSAIMLFFFTLAVSAVAAIVDGCLAHALRIRLRAPLIAVVGATMAGGLACALFRCLLPPAMLLSYVIGGALCMGACSLLSNDYGTKKAIFLAKER